jgi:hypothetical protein
MVAEQPCFGCAQHRLDAAISAAAAGAQGNALGPCPLTGLVGSG